MELIINYQNELCSRISKAKVNFKKSPKERITKEYLEGRLESVDQLWLEFLSGHKELLRTYERKDLNASDYVKSETYDKCEEIFMEYKCELKILLSKFNQQCNKDELSASNVTQTKSSHVKLPKINIPSFSGNYSEWPTFRDLFHSLISQNVSLDKVQKLHYLKSYLAGEAEQLLRHIPIQETNFDRCWQLLEERFNNKKYISHQVLKRLFSQKNLLTESASGLKDLVDTTNDCLATLSNLGIDVRSWDIVIIHILTLKLDSESRRQWEFSVTTNISSDELPTYNQFKEFLTQRFRAIEFLDTKSTAGYRSQTNKVKALHVANETKISCPFCTEGHRLSQCKNFQQKTVDFRRKFVQDNNVCFNCLGSNHSANNCRTNLKCRICKRNHHSLLHPTSSGSNVNVNTAEVNNGGRSATLTEGASASSASFDAGQQTSNVVSCFATGKSQQQVLLATAIVMAMATDGKRYSVRALLDQGSQGSFITESTVQYLGIKKLPVTNQVTGLGGNKNVVSKAMVIIDIQSRVNPNVIIPVKAYVLNNITSVLPSRRVEIIKWEEINELLADPQYYIPNKIDILLGAEVYSQVLQDGLRRGPFGTPIAQATSLGWILSGGANSNAKASANINVMHCCTNENNEMLKKFWELESDIPQPREAMFTKAEQQCEEHFNENTRRDKDGRYIVRLPFVNGTPEVTGSKEIAEKRLRSLEHRLNKDEYLKLKYRDVIDEYLTLGHMEEVPKSEVNNAKAIYLPHHAVIRQDKDTTKVRVVFDASCKGKNNQSLNDQLLVGPTLQPELRHIITQWRKAPICMAADIVKMYRQVKTDMQDADYQRILWRDDKTGDLKHYRLTRVTFGTAAAPYLAVKSLQQVAHDHGADYPSAAEIILKHFYVDDLMTGVQNIEEGKNLYREMNELLGKGGFSLQKWTSNSEELLQEMKDSEKEKKNVQTNGKGMEEELKIKTDEVMKIVGLTWNRSEDSFRYQVDMIDVREPATKRTIISDISRFYDPLGWVGPSIIISKMLIQKLWLAGLNWDETVPTNILNEWKTYKSELMLLSNVSIPRWIGLRSNEFIELHGFSDASKDAYAAVVYARVIDSNGQIHVSLIAAKTKVAPVKQVSIPRLELCGAVLLTRLIMDIASVMEIEKTYLHAWTDSTVVLAWLNSHPSRWKVFVANRVSEIITNLDPHHWSHVSTKCNPADAASRGQSPSELVQNQMWFEGPNFLRHDPIEYSKPKEISTNIEEVKIKAHCATIDESILKRFSSLTRMVRVMAYCIRFVHNLKRKITDRTFGFLTTQELNNALNCCIRQCQKDNFSAELHFIEKKENLPKRSNLRSLNPILDQNQILRVGGRLEHASLSTSRKHPILMPKESHLTNLIVMEAHKQTLHGGPQLMLCYLQAKYWILGAGRLVKSHFRSCVTCVKNTGNTQTQLMGQLPSARSTPARPFLSSGVDYAGPIQIRTSKGRGNKSHKGYICLFVCMVTRAVHLEAVTDLTTEGFLQAFKRFVSRRGYCSEIWSDNATNFTGAASELKRLFRNEKGSMVQEIAESLATNGCSWNFIPAKAPNFGGLWEAGVKSLKYHLKRTIGVSTLTFEEMSTVLAQIEACLNSRPLSVLTGNDDEEVTVLTPGHFLVGEALVTPPDHNFESSNVSSLRRWQYTQRMTQDFWRQWSRQYLTKFYKRYRWSSQMPQPKIGDVVTVREDNLPVCKWLYGRVIATHPGQDNLVRVVTLKVKGGTIKRPVNKLCLLPVTH